LHIDTERLKWANKVMEGQQEDRKKVRAESINKEAKRFPVSGVSSCWQSRLPRKPKEAVSASRAAFTSRLGAG
jgi:hypothetical protein